MAKDNRNNNFVYIDDHGLLGSNFYWRKGIETGITKDDLARVGLVDERVLVHEDIIESLKKADDVLHAKSFRLYISEGYRSKELYRFINEKIEAKMGKHETARILNMKDMPHSSGKSVDVSLWDENKNNFTPLRNKKHGFDAYFVDYYKNSESEEEKEYQRLQEMIINLMQDCGFRLGTKREYFHFNYEPNSPRNY